MITNEKNIYRNDIDGMRAIAVMSVIIYHYHPKLLTGGFVGVDIFYVISGYLITNIIFDEIIKKKFTFSNFYERRIRRIIPALFFMLVLVNIASQFILLPTDRSIVNHSIIYTILSVSNIYYWRNSGYFDTISELNPLLHTWSLAIEEQFYIFFPVILIILCKFTKKNVGISLLILTIISFLLCVAVQFYRPTATFFLLPFRAWELGLGGTLAVSSSFRINNHIYRNIVAIIGALVTAVSIFCISPSQHFPGWLAALPVMGAALLIITGGHEDSSTFAEKILANNALIYIGTISYSLYLWHYPVFVFSRYIFAFQDLSYNILYVYVVAFSLALISYYFIEKPFRSAWGRNRFRKNYLFYAVGTSAIFILTPSIIQELYYKTLSSYPEYISELDKTRTLDIPYKACDGNPAKNFANKLCLLGDQEKEPTILLIGDSQALAWAPVLDIILKKSKLGGLVLPNSACPPLYDVINPVDPYCRDENKFIESFISKNNKIKYVIMHAAWVSYSQEPGFYSIISSDGQTGNLKVFTQGLYSTVNRILQSNKKVIIIGPTPPAPLTPLEIILKIKNGLPLPAGQSLTEFENSTVNYRSAIDKLPNSVVYLNPSQVMCDNKFCKYMNNGQILYRDQGHIGVYGAAYMASKIGDQIVRLISDENR